MGKTLNDASEDELNADKNRGSRLCVYFSSKMKHITEKC